MTDHPAYQAMKDAWNECRDWYGMRNIAIGWLPVADHDGEYLHCLFSWLSTDLEEALFMVKRMVGAAQETGLEIIERHQMEIRPFEDDNGGTQFRSYVRFSVGSAPAPRQSLWYLHTKSGKLPETVGPTGDGVALNSTPHPGSSGEPCDFEISGMSVVSYEVELPAVCPMCNHFHAPDHGCAKGSEYNVYGVQSALYPVRASVCGACGLDHASGRCALFRDE